MKNLLFILLTCLSPLLTAQESGTWDGDFKGIILGVSTTLSAQRAGSSWSGTINAEGYIYNLEGTIDGMTSKGTLNDPQTQGSIMFSAKLSGNSITINLGESTDPDEKMEIVFTKSNQQTSPSSPSPAPSRTNANVDQRLCGLWRYTDVYVSGQFSFATDYFMQFNSDGSMVWTDGRTAGGGPDVSMDSGTGDVHPAKWKTESNAVWLDGGNGWEYYGKYYQEGGSLMFTFNNGKKQVWERL